jgi:hypothetical protein
VKININYGELSGLSARTRNALLCAGYKTKNQIIDGIKSGKIKPFSKDNETGYVPNYGPKSHEELCAWLGVPVEKQDKIKPIKPETIKRYIDVLELNGYKVRRKK